MLSKFLKKLSAHKHPPEVRRRGKVTPQRGTVEYVLWLHRKRQYTGRFYLGAILGLDTSWDKRTEKWEAHFDGRRTLYRRCPD
jgi:hypothetical protein